MAYVCESCVNEHKLETAIARCHGGCEICGSLRDDWTQQFVIWTGQVHCYTGVSRDERKAQIEADLLWVKLRNEEVAGATQKSA